MRTSEFHNWLHESVSGPMASMCEAAFRHLFESSTPDLERVSANVREGRCPGFTHIGHVDGRWLVHYSPHAEELARTGFRYGRHPHSDLLASLDTEPGSPSYMSNVESDGNLVFAFDMESEVNVNHCSMYACSNSGEDGAVVFIGSGEKVHCAPDHEDQVIVDRRTVAGALLVYRDGSVYGCRSAVDGSERVASLDSMEDAFTWIMLNPDLAESRMYRWGERPVTESLGLLPAMAAGLRPFTMSILGENCVPDLWTSSKPGSNASTRVATSPIRFIHYTRDNSTLESIMSEGITLHTCADDGFPAVWANRLDSRTFADIGKRKPCVVFDVPEGHEFDLQNNDQATFRHAIPVDWFVSINFATGNRGMASLLGFACARPERAERVLHGRDSDGLWNYLSEDELGRLARLYGYGKAATVMESVSADSKVEYCHEYYEADVPEICHAAKDGDPEAIGLMASEMAKLVRPGTTLVPVPGRTGRATMTLRLADLIAGMVPDTTVADVLRGKPRPSLYELKKNGCAVSADMLGLELKGDAAGAVMLVDNVVATGTTALAARRLLPGARMLAYAMDTGKYR